MRRRLIIEREALGHLSVWLVGVAILDIYRGHRPALSRDPRARTSA